MTDGENYSMQRIIRKVSNLYDSTISIDVSMHFYKDDMTLGCSVAAPLLAVTH